MIDTDTGALTTFSTSCPWQDAFSGKTNPATGDTGNLSDNLARALQV
jgi:hypothetical protein